MSRRVCILGSARCFKRNAAGVGVFDGFYQSNPGATYAVERRLRNHEQIPWEEEL